MPQIQILPEAPTFGSQLGEALGSGFGQGIQQGITTRLNSMLESKKQLGKVRQNVDLLRKRYAKDTFSPDALLKLEDTASDLVRKHGISAQDATGLAFEQLSQQLQPEKKQTLAQQLGGGKETAEAFKGLGSDALAAFQKFLYPFVGQADFASEALSQIQQQLPGLLTSAPIKPPTNEQSLTKSYLETTGGVGPGENKIERLIQGALGAYHPAGALGTFAKEGAEELGAPPIVQAAADALAFVTAIKSGPKVGTAFKANQRILTNAENVAVATGKTAEEVIAKAQQESGADLSKAAAGDAKEINKLNGRINKQVPKGTEKVAQTEKTIFNPKQAIKEREIFGSKLAESPFEYYFDVEAQKSAKEASKKPETLAKEAEITSRVKPIEEAKYSELQSQKQELNQLKSEVGKLQGTERSRVESLIGFKERQIQKTIEELKDLQYELKYFRKRPTEAEIEAQVRKSGEEIIAEVKNPTPEGQKGIQRQLKSDQEYLDRADKLLQRGELPGEIRPDTHIKMKQKYLDGYNAMISELKEANRALRGARDAESLKTISDNKRAIEQLQNRTRRLKSDIVTQTDKLKAMKAIEGPSGAFYRQQIKSLRKDVAEFQKDFFRNKQGKPETISEAITEKVASSKFKESEKLGEELGKKPTKENLQKGSEITGEKPAELKEDVDNLKNKMKERAEKLESGTATENDVKKTENDSQTWFRAKRNIKAAGKHFLFGMATGVAEEVFDVKIPRTYLYGATTLAGRPTRIAGRAIGFPAGHSFVQYLFNKHESNKLSKVRNNPNEYTKYVQSLRKRYSSERVNDIIEMSKP
jgi:hypothetical protein